MSELVRFKDITDAIGSLPNDADVSDIPDMGSYQMALEDVLRAIDGVDEVQTAEAVQGWIPCSERLLTQTGEYLVTVDYNGCKFTDKFGYEPTINGGWYDAEAPNQKFVDWNGSIVAWMPLPKPYKGGENE